MKNSVKSWQLHRLAAVVVVSIWASEAGATPFLLVNNADNDTIVKFDIATGAAELYATYTPGDDPRNLAMNEQGEVFGSLAGGNQNVVKFVPQMGSTVLTSQNFTPNIGNFGPGQLQFHGGDLYVAGDRSRVIYQYNGTTGAQIRTFSASTSFNIRAMTIAGDNLYYTEIFQDRVRKFNLAQVPPTGGTFFTDTTHLNDSWNMTAGHSDRLVIANRADTLIQQFDIDTGAFLGTLANLKTYDPALTRSVDVTYNSQLNNYFVSAGDVVYRISQFGGLLQTYQSPLLRNASGLVAVPEPSALVMCLIGLAGLAWWRRRASPPMPEPAS